MTDWVGKNLPYSASRGSTSGKLSAVFFLELSSPISPMINAWLQDGNYLSAVVFYRQTWPAPWTKPARWLSIRPTLRLLDRNRIRLINMSSPTWEQLQDDLLRDRPDVGLCFGFPRLIPASVRSLFPHGVLNFHPALLPQYRGPKPLHWLALDNAWKEYGGVTLHEMTSAFDEGPILAQVAMSDIPETDQVGTFIANAIGAMIRRVVPSYCRGDVLVTKQPEGTYRYAGKDVPKPVVQSHWTKSQLKVICKVFAKRPGVCIDVSGKLMRLAGPLRDLGLPTGEVPAVGLSSIAFDLADGRVSYRRYSQISKLTASVTNRKRWHIRSNVPIRISPIRFRPAGGD